MKQAEDVELKQVIEASEASFKEEAVMRTSEDEQLKQALRLSLLEGSPDEGATTESESDDDEEEESTATTDPENELL